MALTRTAKSSAARSVRARALKRKLLPVVPPRPRIRRPSCRANGRAAAAELRRRRRTEMSIEGRPFQDSALSRASRRTRA